MVSECMFADFITLTFIGVYISIKTPVVIVVRSAAALDREHAITVQVFAAVAPRAAILGACAAFTRPRWVERAHDPAIIADTFAIGSHLAVGAAERLWRRRPVAGGAVLPLEALHALVAGLVGADVAVACRAAGPTLNALAALAILPAEGEVGGTADRDTLLINPALSAGARCAGALLAINTARLAVGVLHAVGAATIVTNLVGPTADHCAIRPSLALQALAGDTLFRAVGTLAHIVISALDTLIGFGIT